MHSAMHNSEQKMTRKYVLTDGKRIAVTRWLDGSNLPNQGKGFGFEWKAVRRIDDGTEAMPAGFDAGAVERDGYQILLNG